MSAQANTVYHANTLMYTEQKYERHRVTFYKQLPYRPSFVDGLGMMDEWDARMGKRSYILLSCVVCVTSLTCLQDNEWGPMNHGWGK